jgi:hypothetical protein
VDRLRCEGGEMRESRRKRGDNATEAADLLEELTDEWEALEDLRDPRPWWRHKLSKVWEVAKTIASFAILLGIGWAIYDQYPESRGVIKVVALTAAVFSPLAMWEAISRARRRRRRRHERNLRDLATIRKVLNEPHQERR